MPKSNNLQTIFKFLNKKKSVSDAISGQPNKNISSLIRPYLKGNIHSSSSQSTKEKQLSFSGSHAFFARMKRAFGLEKKEFTLSGMSGSYRPLTADEIEWGTSIKETSSGLNFNQEILLKKKNLRQKNHFLINNAYISETNDQDWKECDSISIEHSSTQLPNYIITLQIKIQEKLNENTEIINEIHSLFLSKDRKSDDLTQVLEKINSNFGEFFPPTSLIEFSSYIKDPKYIQNVFNPYKSVVFEINDLAKQKLEKNPEYSLTYQKNIPITDLDAEENSEFLKDEKEIPSKGCSYFEEHNDEQRLLNALNKTKKNVIDIRNCLDDFNKKLDYLMNENEQQDLEYSKGDSKAFTHGLGLGK